MQSKHVLQWKPVREAIIYYLLENYKTLSGIFFPELIRLKIRFPRLNSTFLQTRTLFRLTRRWKLSFGNPNKSLIWGRDS